MKTEYKSKGISPMIVSAVAMIAFALSLTLAITSLSSADGEMKAARGAPDSLVSAGAPRSQLELKRMFESMSRTYTENGKAIYEPIIAEYRQNRELSVEEILFIISDSTAAYDKYDIIRFGEIDINTFDASQTAEKPFHRSAYDRIRSVTELIKLRIEYMSGTAMTEGDNGEFRYSDSAFVFSRDSIVFEAASGRKVVLYPSEKESALCRTKVLLGASGEMTEKEKDLLFSSGYDASRTRNITPEYWYSETEIRLFVFGGRVILADVELCEELLPEEFKLTSAAIAHTGENEEVEIYFTASSENGSSVWKYSRGELEKIFDSEEEYLAVTEPLESESYDRVEVYAASAVEDGRFVTALECIGEPIETYS